jgi:hypothetical protein
MEDLFIIVPEKCVTDCIGIHGLLSFLKNVYKIFSALVKMEKSVIVRV